MKSKPYIAFLLALIVVASMLAACGGSAPSGGVSSAQESAAGSSTASTTSTAPAGNDNAAEPGKVNKEGFPIVNEPITLRVFGQQGPVQEKWETMSMFREYQEMTGVNLDFTDVLPAEGFDERKNLMWASGDYPDIFVRSILTNAELIRYGDMGVLAPLQDLMAEYAPNIMALIDEYPAILSRITAPDGNIYAVPAVITLNAARCEKFWINTAWLEHVNLPVPKTMDEFEAVLRAFKASPDFSPDVETYPMGAPTADTLIRRMVGVWGHQVQFGQLLEVENGVVSSYITDDSFKDMLQWMAQMYAEGLIDPEIFTQEYARYAAKMSGQQMGFFFNQADDTFDSTNFAGIGPFAGKADRQYAEAQPIARDNGVFAISASCENPEAAMRWIDYFYGYEGSIFIRYGVEGENMFFDGDGLPRYNDGILNSSSGSGTEIGKFTIWPGGNAPQWIHEDNCEAIASQATIAAEAALNPHFPENIYAAPMLAQDVNDRLSIIQGDLENYRKETTAKFILGELNFEADWDTYVRTMEQIGLEEWVSIYQEAFSNLG